MTVCDSISTGSCTRQDWLPTGNLSQLPVAYHSKATVHEEHKVGRVEHESDADISIRSRGRVPDGLVDECVLVSGEARCIGHPAQGTLLAARPKLSDVLQKTETSLSIMEVPICVFSIRSAIPTEAPQEKLVTSRVGITLLGRQTGIALLRVVLQLVLSGCRPWDTAGKFLTRPWETAENVVNGTL